MGSLKAEHFQLFEQFKEVANQQNSLKGGLKNAETQAEEQRRLLNMTEINLVTEKALVGQLRAELQKAKETAKLAQRDV